MSTLFEWLAWICQRDMKLCQSVPVNKRVAVALWCLATGDINRSTGLQFDIGRCTAMLMTHDFCQAIAKWTTEFIKFPETEQELLQSICFFTNKSLFPQVVEGIDGSHIALKTVPLNEWIEYLNRKQGYSIVIQGVCSLRQKSIHHERENTMLFAWEMQIKRFAMYLFPVL